MKAKHTIFIIVLGFSLDYIGVLFRILHRPGANELFVVATVIKVTGILLFAYKVVTYEGFRKFMNR